MKTKLLNLIIIIVGLLLIVNLTRSLSQLVGSWGKINEAKKETELSQKKNNELQAKLKEAQSSEFIEKIARDKLGLAKEGETMVILPLQQEQSSASGQASDKEIPNWQKWWKLFF